MKEIKPSNFILFIIVFLFVVSCIITDATKRVSSKLYRMDSETEAETNSTEIVETDTSSTEIDNTEETEEIQIDVNRQRIIDDFDLPRSYGLTISESGNTYAIRFFTNKGAVEFIEQLQYKDDYKLIDICDDTLIYFIYLGEE